MKKHTHDTVVTTCIHTLFHLPPDTQTLCLGWRVLKSFYILSTPTVFNQNADLDGFSICYNMVILVWSTLFSYSVLPFFFYMDSGDFISLLSKLFSIKQTCFRFFNRLWLTGSYWNFHVSLSQILSKHPCTHLSCMFVRYALMHRVFNSWKSGEAELCIACPLFYAT